MFHLLSSSRSRGHRTSISKISFRSLEITLRDGYTISAIRKATYKPGPYRIELRKSSKQLVIVDVTMRDDGSVDPKTTNLSKIEHFLDNLHISPYYLSEYREFSSDNIRDEDESNYFSMELDSLNYRDFSQSYRSMRRLVDDSHLELPRQISQYQELSSAVDRVERWLQLQAYSSASTGLANANSVYLDVMTHLSNTSVPLASPDHLESEKLVADLKAFEFQDSQYARFGLGVEFPAKQYIKILQSTPSSNRPTLVQILRRHLDSNRAQLGARTELYFLLTTFTTAMNEFLTDKELSIHASPKGITIRTLEGDRLSLTELSSGERQLLLLLCNTIVARDKSKLFIIDEPEISLNVKWQRNLLDVLLSLTNNSDLQFLIATHSIEMVTGYRSGVSRLASIHEK